MDGCLDVFNRCLFANNFCPLLKVLQTSVPISMWRQIVKRTQKQSAIQSLIHCRHGHGRGALPPVTIIIAGFVYSRQKTLSNITEHPFQKSHTKYLLLRVYRREKLQKKRKNLQNQVIFQSFVVRKSKCCILHYLCSSIEYIVMLSIDILSRAGCPMEG